MTNVIKEHYLDFDNPGESNVVGDVVTISDAELDSVATDGGWRLCVRKGGSVMPLVDRYGLCRGAIAVPARCPVMKAVLAAGGESFLLFPTADLRELVVSSGIRQADCDTFDWLGGAPCAVHGKTHDLQGRRVENPSALRKGIYIVGGRKVVR